jgi:hypothetical protein
VSLAGNDTVLPVTDEIAAMARGASSDLRLPRTTYRLRNEAGSDCRNIRARMIDHGMF